MRSHAADRPISSEDQDRFGRTPFASHLGKALSEWDGHESIVVGLNGPWGAGKTSVKNLLLERMEKVIPLETRPDVLEFNPWAVSSQGGMLARFFREIGTILGRPDRSEQSSKIEKTFRAWAAALNLTEQGAKTVHHLLTAPLFVSALTIFASGTIAGSWWYQVIGVLFAIAAGLFHFSKTVAEATANFFRLKAELHKKSLEERKAELVSALRQRSKSLIVILDDIDRLQVSEIRTLFQFVKACGDLPKISYLLLFQRDVVERSLQNEANPDGASFLKKIVQLEFDLPFPSQQQLDGLLFERLDEILAEVPFARFDHGRWTNLYLGGLQHFFRTPRDINRFATTYEFQLGLLGGPRNPEVDPVDLLGIEAIRTFEPSLYEQLPALKDILTKSGVGEGFQIRGESTKQILGHLFPDDRPTSKETLIDIFKFLFPPIAWAFDGSTFGYEFAKQWDQAYRVCSSDFFDRYFMLTIPNGDISKAEIDLILENQGDRTALVGLLDSLRQRGELPVAIHRLHQFKDALKVEALAPFVEAIFDIGDLLPNESSPARIGAFNEALFLINWFLSQEKDEERRETILENAIQSTSGAAMPCSLVAWQYRDAEHGSLDYIIREKELKRFQLICAKRLALAGAGKGLSENLHLGRLLHYWIEWTDGTEARKWAEDFVQAGGALSLLNALSTKGMAQTIGDHFARPLFEIRLEHVGRFISLDLLKAGLDAIPKDEISEEQRQLLTTFHKALENRSK